MAEALDNQHIPRSLLVVDDNDLFRRSIGKLLQLISRNGIQNVYEASTGNEAMELLSKNSIDCILLDYQMPGGDGVHWLNQFTKQSPGSAVIMITGEGDEAVAVAAMKAGAMDYLTKESIRETELLRAITNAMERLQLKRALEYQREQLLQAERQRAMITSVATACHHLGQPAMVILSYLQLMERRETSPEMKTMIHKCLKAADGIADILRRLQGISEYRTIPYLANSSKEDPNALHILDI
jgi:FixJ family two-component response regulator